MNHAFFEELQIPPPHYNLGIKTPSATRRLGEMIQKLDPVFTAEKPDLVVVVGDVDSTLAGALAANKGGIPLAHIEAGLRSFSDEMPEETNRKLTDHLAQYLFATEP
ncbi:MAG: UDP-N-acetylglucosamine 2-epimerase (non-hydrolyzing), partial [Bacteroidetes bacterium]